MAEFIAGLTAEQRALTVPGTFGGVEHTMSHVLNAEGGYLSALGGTIDWERPRDDASPGVGELQRRAGLLSNEWRTLLSGSIDLDRAIRRGQWTTPAGQVVTQAIHHGNEHRGHICTILGAHGLEWPDVSAWAWEPGED
jgi:uncharacterized damage-inducible protein DinB